MERQEWEDEQCLQNSVNVHFEYKEGHGRITLRWISGSYVVRIRGKWNKLSLCPVAGFGISSTEPLGSGKIVLVT
jgi:hypothetical protein